MDSPDKSIQLLTTVMSAYQLECRWSTQQVNSGWRRNDQQRQVSVSTSLEIRAAWVFASWLVAAYCLCHIMNRLHAQWSGRK